MTRTLLLSLALSGTSLAQAPDPAPAAPVHKHYEESKEAEKPAPTGELAPRLQNLGSHAFPVTTKSRKAQLFVNQGVNLAYGFNHAEAGRAFREAARLDPGCAMCYWGQAFVLGPNINVPMSPDDEPKAYELAQKAVALKAKATPRERLYIDAVAKRYTGRKEDRDAANQAFADAMGVLAKKYPADLDAQTIYAESLMDLRPWNYWTGDGRPYPGTEELVSTLERVLVANKNHPGANHLYIHAVEATKSPERAEAAADRLGKLMPGAGHMVHMPSHIYQRVGRYADAVAANAAAAKADEDYISQCRAQGIYPMAYYPHNIHFLWYAATAEGRSAEAIAAARKTAAQVSDEQMDALPLLGAFRVVPHYALARFGKWDEVLAEPLPAERYPYPRAVAHYARGLAQLRKGNLDEAEKELEVVKRMAADKALDYTLFSPNSAAAIFAPAPEVLAGEIAAQRKQYDIAVAHLARAVRLEDSLFYTEPEEWHYPSRQALGAVLLEAGRAREAETVYWDDLRRHSNNGWSLFGLAQALRAQGKSAEADAVQARFDKAWGRADVKLSASRF